MSAEKMREALELAGQMVESHYPRHREYKVAAALIASQAAQGEAVPAFWAAVTDDDIIEMSHSTDDGNGGLASRQEVNDWINENDPRMHLVGLYTAPPAPAVPDTVAKIAAIAHDGGLAGLSESAALVAIRRLTAKHCETVVMSTEARRDAVLAAAPEVPHG